MSEEEKEVFDKIKDRTQNGCKCGQCCDERVLINLIDKQQKLINTFISNEAVKEGKDFLKNALCEKQKEIEEKNIAINKMSKDISRQLEEIEEKRTIIFAGAEKVKQLEKEIEEMREELQMYVDVQNNDIHNYISKDKIREKIKEIESFDRAMHQKNGKFTILVLKGLINDEDTTGNHIPMID